MPRFFSRRHLLQLCVLPPTLLKTTIVMGTEHLGTKFEEKLNHDPTQ